MLDKLNKRLIEIENAIASGERNLMLLNGHKNEVVYQIGELQKDEAPEKQEEKLETQVESPVE